VDRDTINVLSLCSGVGGLDLGLELATGGAARVVCHVEREAFAAAILAARMEDETVARAPVWSDLRTFDGRAWRGVVDCVIGGYPCQPFSFAGRRGGENDPRHLWPEVARIVAEVQPGIVFFENVGGHLSLGFDDVSRDLHRMGYRVTAGLFTAAEVGAPHRRERLFILGVADGSRGGCGELRPASGRDGRAEQDGGDVADAGRERPQGECEGRATARATGRGDGAALADASNGLVPLAGRGPQGRDGVGPAGASLPVFPPGPGARAEWERILRYESDLAPATTRTPESEIRRMADGMASRLDRLRACGNGVVSLVAAYAFVSLWACLREE